MEASKSGLTILGEAMERSRDNLAREQDLRLSPEAQAQADAGFNKDLINMLTVVGAVEDYKNGEITEAEYSNKSNEALGKLEEGARPREPENTKEPKQEEKQLQKS